LEIQREVREETKAPKRKRRRKNKEKRREKKKGKRNFLQVSFSLSLSQFIPSFSSKERGNYKKSPWFVISLSIVFDNPKICLKKEKIEKRKLNFIK
jgi:hypothetical protein